jgi:hypothetical protein
MMIRADARGALRRSGARASGRARFGSTRRWRCHPLTSTIRGDHRKWRRACGGVHKLPRSHSRLGSGPVPDLGNTSRVSQAGSRHPAGHSYPAAAPPHVASEARRRLLCLMVIRGLLPGETDCYLPPMLPCILLRCQRTGGSASDRKSFGLPVDRSYRGSDVRSPASFGFDCPVPGIVPSFPEYFQASKG